MREATLDDRRTRSSVKSASGGLPANSTRVGVVTHAGCDSGLPPGVLFASNRSGCGLHRIAHAKSIARQASVRPLRRPALALIGERSLRRDGQA